MCVCAYVCVNILSHISRVAQPGLLYVLSPVTIRACALCIASLPIIPLKLGISPSCRNPCFPLLYPQYPSITTLPVGWMLSSLVSKASPAPWCLQHPVLSLVPWDAASGVGQGLWLCSWPVRSCSTVGGPDPALRWSESCIWEHLATTMQVRRLGADSAAGQGVFPANSALLLYPFP